MAIKEFDFKALDRYFALILGESGAGKTQLLSTIPEDKTMLIVSAENGMLTIRDMLINRQNTVKCVTIDDWADMEAIIQKLQQPKNKAYYDYVAFDSLTAISHKCFQAMEKTYPTDSYKAYGKLGDKICDMLELFRDKLTDYTILMTCLVQTDVNGKGKNVYTPKVTGRVTKDNLMSFFDEVWLITPKMSLSNKKAAATRVIYTDAREDFPAKDRSHALAYEEVPDLTVISNKIFGYFEAEPDSATTKPARASADAKE
jgi:hypothetical protein